MHHIFIHSSVDGHLGCFHVLDIENRAAMNIGILVSFSILIFSGYMPSIYHITGLYNRFIPSFLRNLHSILHSGCICINVHFHKPCSRVPFSLPPLQCLLFVDFFDDGHCDCRGVLVHFLCTSLIINNVEHLFMCLLAICVSSLQKCLFRSAHFLIGLFGFLILSCMSCLYILEINPLLVVLFAIIFSHSEACLLILCFVSLLYKTSTFN